MIERSALISPCGRYRYSLSRKWGDEPPHAFIMLNPSTADAEIDDPTIRRCMSFARRESAGGIVVVNLFAFRSPSPAALFAADDPIGPDNWLQLCRLANEAIQLSTPVVCAWGAHARRGTQAEGVRRLFKTAGVNLLCLGKTSVGEPRHPLFIRADQPLELFE